MRLSRVQIPAAADLGCCRSYKLGLDSEHTTVDNGARYQLNSVHLMINGGLCLEHIMLNPIVYQQEGCN